MEMFVALFARIVREDDGQDMVEYALLVGLISVAAIAALITARGAINTLWTAVTAALATATGAL